MNSKRIGTVVLAVGIVLLILMSFTSISGNIKLGDIITKKPEVTCTVGLGAGLTEVFIRQEANCQFTGKECTSLFSSSVPLGILTESGKVIFDANDQKVIETFKVSRFYPDVIIIGNLCTSSESVNVIIKNEEGQIVDSQLVVIQ